MNVLKNLHLKFWEYPQVLFVVILLYFLSFFLKEILISTIVFLLFLGVFVFSIFNKLIIAKRKELNFVSVVTHQLRGFLIAQKQDKMKKVVDNLLETDKAVLNKETFSLYKMIRKEIESFKPMSQDKNMRIELNAETNLTDVIADKTKIAIVFQNILENALKYGKEGSGIKVGIESRDKSLRVSITGSVREDQPYTFEKTIIELSGGEIGFESDLETTFWFSLPV